jgi:hypothetical protein
MMRVDVTRMLAPATLRLGLLAGFLAIAGCSDPARGDKTDDPTLKSMQNSMELYKSKAAPKKGSSASLKTRQGYPTPLKTRR